MNMEQQETGTAELSGPGGWKARFTGVDTRIVLLSLLITISLSLAAYGYQENKRMDEESKTVYLDNHKITQTLLTQVITNQRLIIETIHEAQRQSTDSIGDITYVLTLNQMKREALKLEMPWSLRKKLNER